MSFLRKLSFFSAAESLCDTWIKEMTYRYELAPYKFATITGHHHPDVSHLPGHPFIGRFFQLMAKDGIGHELLQLADLAKKDPLHRAYSTVLYRPLFLITDPADIAQVMLFNDKKISRPATMEGFSKLIGEHTVFTLPANEAWRKKRTDLQKWLFTAKALNDVAPKMQLIIDEFIELARDKKQIPSLELFLVALTMDVFSRTQLATTSVRECSANIAHQFYDALSASADIRNTVLMKIQGVLQYFYIKINTPLDRQRLSLHETINNQVLRPNENSLRSIENILQPYYLDSADDKKSAIAALADATFLLFAGHETTARLLQFCFLILAKNPSLLTKLREEIVMHEPSDGKWTPADLEKMHFLWSFIKETLRLYPPIPFYPREVITEFKLCNIPYCDTPEKYQQEKKQRDKKKDVILTKGTYIFISPWITQSLPSLYPNPDEFDATRFLSAIKMHPKKAFDIDIGHGFFPFGADHRHCVGRLFALQEAAITLIKFAKNFDFSLINSQSDHSFLDVFFHGTLKYNGDVSINFKPY